MGPRVIVQNEKELMDMKEKELKKILERYQVNYQDCFNKQQLVHRILDRCPRAA
jgi:predicted Zn-dependent protease